MYPELRVELRLKLVDLRNAGYFVYLETTRFRGEVSDKTTEGPMGV